MATLLNKPEDIQWLKDTCLKGVILPTEYHDFKCAFLIGNEDCPTRLHIYNSHTPLLAEPYLDMKFEYDIIYCTYKEMTPTEDGQKASKTEAQIIERYSETAMVNDQPYGRLR